MSQRGLKACQGGLRASQGDLRASQRGRMDIRTNVRSFSPFYRTLSPLGAAAQKGEQSPKIYHLLSPSNLSYPVLLLGWHITHPSP